MFNRRKINTIKKWSKYYFYSFLSSVGLKNKDDYTKFIILSRSRTGSNFLRGLLNSHSKIYTFGELFREADRKKGDYKIDILNYHRIQEIKNCPVEYLRKRIFRKQYNENILAVGFKLFYYHAHKCHDDILWDEILKDKSIKIIHLTRRNYLKTVLSRKKAEITDTWLKQGKRDNNPLVKISPEECLRAFEWTSNLEDEYTEKFKDHDVYNLVYEDLVQNQSLQMNKVLNFLDLPLEDLCSDTVKQSSKPIEEEIVNYKELKNYFKDSKWSNLFQS